MSLFLNTTLERVSVATIWDFIVLNIYGAILSFCQCVCNNFLKSYFTTFLDICCYSNTANSWHLNKCIKEMWCIEIAIAAVIQQGAVLQYFSDFTQSFADVQQACFLYLTACTKCA